MGFPCECDPRPTGGQQCCVDGRCREGQRVNKFDECGYFAFGGSTTLVLFQPDAIRFDSDLQTNSDNQLETLVKVGTGIGRSTGKYKVNKQAD